MRGLTPAASGVGDGRIGEGTFTDQVADSDCGCGWMAQAPAGTWKSYFGPLRSAWSGVVAKFSPRSLVGGVVAQAPRGGLRVSGPYEWSWPVAKGGRYDDVNSSTVSTNFSARCIASVACCSVQSRRV